jgi:hypothetical protein
LARRYCTAHVDAAKERLRELPAREPARNLTLERTIRSLRPDIQRALKRGNSLFDIADALKGEAIQVGVRTLESYLRRRAGKARPAMSLEAPLASSAERPA